MGPVCDPVFRQLMSTLCMFSRIRECLYFSAFLVSDHCLKQIIPMNARAMHERELQEEFVAKRRVLEDRLPDAIRCLPSSTQTVTYHHA